MIATDILLAKNTNLGIRRLCVAISIILAVIWSFVFYEEMGDFYWFSASTWLTYFIGLAIAALGPTLGFGLYWALPPLGKTRRGDLIAMLIIAVILCALIYSQAADISARGITSLTPWGYIWGNFEEVAPLVLALVVVGTVGLKILLWLWQGFHKPT